MKRFLLLGEQVRDSRSPAIHSAAYAQLGVDCTYEARSIARAELPALVAELRAGRWAGLNITAPFKFDASRLCDREEGPVVNTLWRADDGAVCGTNTDISGLDALLRTYLPSDVDLGRKAYVLGGGATALSAVEALRLRGFARVVLVARDVARAQALAECIGGVAVVEWGAPSDVGAAVVVQASSAPPLAPLDALQWRASEAKAVVLDARYGPASAPFVNALRAEGYRAHSGERMLVVQAAEAIRRWFGASVDVEAMGRTAFGVEAWQEVHSV